MILNKPAEISFGELKKDVEVQTNYVEEILRKIDIILSSK